jgi:A/G-specific adenine glycosylase
MFRMKNDEADGRIDDEIDGEIYDEARRTILAWYAECGREFFWRKKRGERPEPYVTLLSEVVLQQTQTSRVQEKLPVFLAQFPTIAALAAADNATVIRAWAGMGYNSRALRLRDCARAIVERHASQIPSALPDLLALPGIGAYTASAVAAFAYHQDVPVVDVNIRRVYSRMLAAMPTTTAILPEAYVERCAGEIFPRGQSSDWHQAVMDVGALFCTARQPKCGICPIQHLCASAGKMVETKAQKRAEPSFRGQPNRIWRGRIVQMLRNATETNSGGLLTFDDVLSGLFPTMMFDDDFASAREEEREEKREEEVAWLMRVVEGLEKDRIAQVMRSASREYRIRLFEEEFVPSSIPEAR